MIKAKMIKVFKIIIIYVNRYMETCRECPNRYPWLGDSKGTGLYNDNYNPEKK